AGQARSEQGQKWIQDRDDDDSKDGDLDDLAQAAVLFEPGWTLAGHQPTQCRLTLSTIPLPLYGAALAGSTLTITRGRDRTSFRAAPGDRGLLRRRTAQRRQCRNHRSVQPVRQSRTWLGVLRSAVHWRGELQR